MVFINNRKTIASAVMSIAALLIMSATVVQYSSAATMQQQPGQTGQSGLKFFIKYKSTNATTSTQGTTASSASGAANNTSAATKKITVNVNLQRGPGGNPIKLPITATVPASAKMEDLQLCASLPTGSQSCQPLSAKGGNIDLTKQSQGTTSANNTGAAASPTTGSPASPKAYISNGDAKITGAVFTTSPESTLNANLYTQIDALIGITNTSVNIPVTVIVPVNVQIQNAQVCASVLSGGSQSCEQLVLNPSQTTFSPINVNLNTPTPTFTSTPTSTSTQSTTTNPLSPTLNGLTSTPPPSTSTPPPSTSTPPPSTSTPPPSTSSGSGSTSSGSGSTSSGSTSGSGK